MSAPLQAPLSMLDGYGLLDRCQDCSGTGIVIDDGSVTDVIGWPLPCTCVESLPASVRVLMRDRARVRTDGHLPSITGATGALRTARPSRTALCGGDL